MNILISQSIYIGPNSPYLELSKKKNVKIYCKSFIKIIDVSSSYVRRQKINFSDFNAIIFLSKKSVDYYFRIANSMRFKIPTTMKYFCKTESIAFYLQKYITYRKRKIYTGKKNFSELIPYIKNNSNKKFLLPSSDILSSLVPNMLNKLKIFWERVILYKTVSNDLSDINIKNIYYDILVFFSPAGIKSLFHNFPKFNQKKTTIATFGKNTFDEAYKSGLKIDIKIPNSKFTSMAMALEEYIKKTKEIKYYSTVTDFAKFLG
ncbi:uroporphyrinogen-III synthase [Blattabacterium cuenoti]|uniref:uroporphyrinogen-III synthase n=1 Tax=Blattabacterium cuenoti TaxID=1653831 RepID=UPI00163C0124|nr:uroporphyrinogen-III synthase [Blattabacterium cuenoti]